MFSNALSDTFDEAVSSSFDGVDVVVSANFAAEYVEINSLLNVKSALSKQSSYQLGCELPKAQES